MWTSDEGEAFANDVSYPYEKVGAEACSFWPYKINNPELIAVSGRGNRAKGKQIRSRNSVMSVNISKYRRSRFCEPASS